MADAKIDLRFGAALGIAEDPVDLRDQRYLPRLFEYPVTLMPDMKSVSVREQIVDGPCTGFALAAVIDIQNRVRREGLNRLISDRQARLAAGGNPDADPELKTLNATATLIPEKCSARMLYEMARSHDEFVETMQGADVTQGSSLRGVVKGFYHNGAATEDPVQDSSTVSMWSAGIDRYKQARNVMLGAYYRMSPVLNHYHSAIAEVGAVLVSARIHDGWARPRSSSGEPGLIQWSPDSRLHGGHAFAVVGYDDKGFIVLNSWGARWGGFNGEPGLAHWSYADWAANVMDAWVLRLGVPTPAAFDFSIGEHGQLRTDPGKQTGFFMPSLPRSTVVGHFANIDDGAFVTGGSYPTDLESVQETAAFLVDRYKAPKADRKYEALTLFAHGGLNDLSGAINRVGAMKDGFKRNGVYPFFFCWNTGLFGEASDILSRIFLQAESRTGAGLRSVFDSTLEKMARVPGRALWREMKAGAKHAFDKPTSAGAQTITAFCDAFSDARLDMPIHLIGHSAGAIFLGEMISRMPDAQRARIRSVSLLAPACTTQFFVEKWLPFARQLTANGKHKERFALYNLNADYEKNDTVGPYGKSLLYFVSNAFEERHIPTRDTAMPIAGMDEYYKQLGGDVTNGKTIISRDDLPFDIHLSGDHKNAASRSTSHGGFDADPVTMNHILSRQTGKRGRQLKGFQPQEIAGI